MTAIQNIQRIKILTDCIVQSILGYDFRWEIFFRLWFRESGNPLFFLFKKNLSVTNTQFVELFALLSKYCYTSHSSDKKKLLLYSTEHIKSTFTEVITNLLEDYNPKDVSKLERFSSQYLDIFYSTVAVDMFFGSCAIFLPYGININLEKIVSDSGYIHSAGKSIYIRNIKKSKKNDFIESIANHLDSDNTENKIPFVIYSHEDFSGFDKDSSDLIERGIEHCKIFVDKMNMGSYRLSSIINEMQNSKKFNQKLLIPEPGNYIKQHSFKSEKTIWLISDRSISGGQIKNPGQNRYYICYEQFLKNDSPFYFFDENKPAWKSHTTLPHSLTAALINISSPQLNNGRICDPFCGTGTTWLETKRLNLNNQLYCSDLSPATNLLVADNLVFFCASVDSLVQLINDLNFCFPEKSLKGQYKFMFNDDKGIIFDPYTQAKLILEQLRKEQETEDQEFYLSESFVKNLNRLPFVTRIVFYVMLRADLRYQGGFKRKAITFEDAYIKSLNKLLEQMNMLLELRKEVAENHILENTNIENISFIKSIATYSNRLIPTLIFRNYDNYIDNLKTEIFSSTDARNLQKDTNDLVICDPPYGFNTNEDYYELAELYSEFIDKVLDSLRHDGQLIMCLPAESFTGRDLPYCTRSDLVSRQILIKAHEKGRLVYSTAKSIPMNSFSPPYYWESERALRRIILHFCFE